MSSAKKSSRKERKDLLPGEILQIQLCYYSHMSAEWIAELFNCSPMTVYRHVKPEFREMTLSEFQAYTLQQFINSIGLSLNNHLIIDLLQYAIKDIKTRDALHRKLHQIEANAKAEYLSKIQEAILGPTSLPQQAIPANPPSESAAAARE